jgi:hypothetical protein
MAARIRRFVTTLPGCRQYRKQKKFPLRQTRSYAAPARTSLRKINNNRQRTVPTFAAAFTIVATRLCSIVADTTYTGFPNRSPGRGTMVDRIRNIMARFPENEDVVRNLILQNRDFDALCQEYAQTGEELQKLAAEIGQGPAAEADQLKGRRRTIEEEILTLIEGYSPA